MYPLVLNVPPDTKQYPNTSFVSSSTIKLLDRPLDTSHGGPRDRRRMDAILVVSSPSHARRDHRHRISAVGLLVGRCSSTRRVTAARGPTAPPAAAAALAPFSSWPHRTARGSVFETGRCV